VRSAFATIKGVNPNQFDILNIYKNFSTEDALWIKETESNQPRCKAVEYFIKDAFEKLGLSQYKEFIHFD
jgi:adenylosuccinate lyase